MERFKQEEEVLKLAWQKIHDENKQKQELINKSKIQPYQPHFATLHSQQNVPG